MSNMSEKDISLVKKGLVWRLDSLAPLCKGCWLGICNYDVTSVRGHRDEIGGVVRKVIEACPAVQQD